MNDKKTLCHINHPEKIGSTGFVFICPGRYEKKNGRPCAGQTGRILDDALMHLNKFRPDIFKYTQRYEYLITNAWDRVEFKEETKRSVPECREIATRSNITRLYDEIKHLKFVVACGSIAHLAVQLCVEFLNFKGAVAYVSHTSRQAIGCPSEKDYSKTIKDWRLQL